MELISEYVSLAAAEGVGSNHHLFRDTQSRPRQTAVMMMRLIALFLFSLAPAPPRPSRPPRHPCHHSHHLRVPSPHLGNLLKTF